MRINKSVIAVTATLGLAAAGSANAVFINGAFGFSNGLEGLVSGNQEIVSGLSTFDFADAGDPMSPEQEFNVGAVSGDFGLTMSPFTTDGDILDLDLGGLPAFVIQIGGWTVEVENITNTTITSFGCSNGLCSDGITVEFTGTVSGNGFDDTFAIVSIGLEGTCVGTPAAGCTEDPIGSYSGIVNALGRDTVPEPGTLALLAMGMLGFGASRRRFMR